MTPLSSPRATTVDLPPAPPDRVIDKVRRRWRSRKRHRGLKIWLIFRGIPIIGGWAALYIANGFVIGWREAYDVSLAIMSPAATAAPALAWPLSLAGWLVAPGVAGAVAGYVISSSIGGHRRKPLRDLFR